MTFFYFVKAGCEKKKVLKCLQDGRQDNACSISNLKISLKNVYVLSK